MQGPYDGAQVGLGQPEQYGSGAPLISRFADGGAVGGEPGLAPQGGQMMDVQMADMHINDMYQRNPQMSQAIQQVVQQGIASGEITPQELNMAIQLARAVLQNPALWPKLRQFAIQQGLAGPNDLPQQYDQSIPLLILSAAKGLEGSPVMQGAQQGQIGMMGQQGGPQAGMQPQQGAQQFADGGMIVGPGTGRSDSVDTTNQSTGAPVKVSNGEYIIPAHVVEAKGKDFFDSLLRKYTPIQQGGK